MSDPTPAHRPHRTLSLEWLTWGILGLAGLLTAIWLWSCWCSFPSNPWNDIRVAPALALSRGISIYTPADAGPVSTWVYGPLPLLVLAPAGLASTAAGAIQVAGAIHILLRVLVVVLVCLLWPRSVAGGNPVQEVSWQVSGVRRDDYAVAHPLRVEANKRKADVGTRQFVPAGSSAKPMQTAPRTLPGTRRPSGPPRQPAAPKRH